MGWRDRLDRLKRTKTPPPLVDHPSGAKVPKGYEAQDLGIYFHRSAPPPGRSNQGHWITHLQPSYADYERDMGGQMPHWGLKMPPQQMGRGFRMPSPQMGFGSPHQSRHSTRSGNAFQQYESRHSLPAAVDPFERPHKSSSSGLPTLCEGDPLPPGVIDPMRTSVSRPLGYHGLREHIPGMTKLEVERHGAADDPQANWKVLEELGRLGGGSVGRGGTVGGGGTARRSGRDKRTGEYVHGAS